MDRFCRQLRRLVRVACSSCVLSVLASAQATAPAPLPPEAAEAIMKGILAAKQQDYLLATRFFQDARKIAPQAPEIYYDLGLAESKIPGRELRAIAWFGAYLAANQNSPNAAAVKDQIDVLDVKNQSNLSRLIKTVEDASSQSTQSKEYALSSVAALWAEEGDLAAALKSVDLISHSDGKITILVAIAEVQTNKGVDALAQQTLATARRTADQTQKSDWHYGYGQSYAYAKIAEAQAKASDIAGAQETAELIPDEFIKCPSQIAIARIQIKGSDLAGANRTLRTVEKTCDLRTDIASAKIQSGDLEGSRQTLLAARKHADSMPANSSDDAYSKTGALAVIFYLQATAGDLSGARQTLAAGLKSLELITNMHDKKFREEQLTKDELGELSYLVDSRIKIGDITGAKEIAELVADPVSRGYRQIDIAIAQARGGDIAGAQITADSIPAGTSYKENALKAIAEAQGAAAKAQVKTGNIAEALRISDLIQDGALKRRTQSEIAAVQMKTGDVAGALRTAGLIQDMQLKSEAQLDIAEGQILGGDLAGAKKTLVYALKTANLIQEMRGKNRVQAFIVGAAARAGDLAGAQRTADLIMDADWKSNAQVYIAEAQAKAGDLAGAKESLSSALKTAGLIQEANDKDFAYSTIATHQSNIGDIAGALKTADQVQFARRKIYTQAVIAAAQAKTGDVAGAKETFARGLKTADLIQEAGLKSLAMGDIAASQVDAGDVPDARETWIHALRNVDFIQNGFEKDLVWESVARTQVKARDIAEAQQTTNLIHDASTKHGAQAAVDEAKGKTNSISNPPAIASSEPAKATNQPVIPVVQVSDWLKRLDDRDKAESCALNTDPFLDLASYLKALPPSDNPQTVFESLRDTATRLVTAQNVIDKMLKQQAEK